MLSNHCKFHQSSYTSITIIPNKPWYSWSKSCDPSFNQHQLKNNICCNNLSSSNLSPLKIHEFLSLQMHHTNALHIVLHKLHLVVDNFPWGISRIRKKRWETAPWIEDFPSTLRHLAREKDMTWWLLHFVAEECPHSSFSDPRKASTTWRISSEESPTSTESEKAGYLDYPSVMKGALFMQNGPCKNLLNLISKSSYQGFPSKHPPEKHMI